ncbi:MAG: hypothetical protein ACOC56_00855 [Atribacterota bacterium]
MQILTKEGFKHFDGFVFSGYSNLLVRFTLSNNDCFECTTDHKILLHNNKFVEADLINEGDVLFGDNIICKKEYVKENKKVYDALNVKDTKSFRINKGTEVHNCLVLDEFAFVPPNIAQDFWAANYPAISASEDSKIIIISTPNGLHNLFWRLYTDAENRNNSFVNMRSTWRDVPGRDDNWKKEQLKNMTTTQFNQEFEVDFIGSTASVIDPDVIIELSSKVKNPIKSELGGDLKIYEMPKDGTEYTIGVDTAKGTGRHYSCIQVLKILSKDPPRAKQVATYESNKIDVYSFTDIVYRIALYYNSAYVIVENNAEGNTVISKLWWDLEYGNLINEGRKKTKMGIRATQKTKTKAVVIMKKMIESRSLELCDYITIKQLSDFVEIKKNVFQGKTLDDDNVSALYWACYLWGTNVLPEGAGAFIDDKEDEAWGILAGVEKIEEDWSWLTSLN